MNVFKLFERQNGTTLNIVEYSFYITTDFQYPLSSHYIEANNKGHMTFKDYQQFWNSILTITVYNFITVSTHKIVQAYNTNR